MWWILLDTFLLFFATLRLTRLVVTDSIGQWWLYGPLYKRAHEGGTSKWAKYVEGLVCPFCVGFWIGALLLGSLALAGGFGAAVEWWRWVTGAFALNWIAGHVASRLD